MTPEAKLYFDMWVELDNLCIAGLGESEEADEFRDRMDKPWWDLNSEDRESIKRAIIDYENKFK